MSDPSAERSRRWRAARQLIFGPTEERVKGDVKSDINVTPLVDVVLVLLIIFMVVTPMIASGVAVDLPRTQNHSRKPDDGKDIIISITQDKRIYVGASAVPRLEDLGRIVTNERRKFPDKSIFLKGDSRAPYGSVKAAMQALHEIEINDITLGTEELSKE